jgi:hypothetical protein
MHLIARAATTLVTTAFVSSDELGAEDGPYVEDYLSPTRTRGISWTTWLRAG